MTDAEHSSPADPPDPDASNPDASDPDSPDTGTPGLEGTPIRVSSWVVPPVLLLALAAFEVYLAVSGWALVVPVVAVAAAVAIVACAAVLGVNGYLAYRDVTPQATRRYRLTALIALAVIGIVLSFELVGIGWVPLVWAGRFAADLRDAGRPDPLKPSRRLMFTTIATGIVGVICVLALPLAVGLGSVPFVVLVIAGRIVAPFAFGFALRRVMRARAAGLAASRDEWSSDEFD